jgi:hypothetical protein
LNVGPAPPFARHVYATHARYGRLSLMEIRRLFASSFILGVLLTVVPASAQTVRQDTFAVSGVSVDVTAQDAGVARDRAIVLAQRKAWDELFKQLLPPGSKPAPVSDIDLSRAVQNFSVDDERLAPGRYSAVMTVRFSPDAVRKALADSGASSFVEPSSKPVVLLPVTVRPDGTPVLWDDRTPWRSAWEAFEGKRGALVPLTVPDGELSDVAAVSAQEAAAGDAKALAKIAGQHGATGVAVAKITLGPEGLSPAQAVKVDVTLTTLDGLSAAKSVNVRADAADRPEDLLSRAVTSAAAAVDELWRQDRTIAAGPQQTLTAVVPLINGLNDWIAARAKLGQLGAGARVDMLSLTRSAATVNIGYSGKVEDLQARMSNQGLTLRQDQGGWTVVLPPPSLSPPPVERGPAEPQSPGRP